MTAIRPFLLGRVFDPVGVSGVGHVAEGGMMVNPNGTTAMVILTWKTQYQSVSVYPNLEVLKQVQCRDNNTLIIDAQTLRSVGKKDRAIADRLPAPFSLVKMSDGDRPMRRVACGCQFSNGKVGLIWTIDAPIVSWFDNFDDLKAIHVRDENSRIVWAKPSEL